MKVKVELLPGLRKVQDKRKFEVELPEGATVKDMLLSVGFGEDEIQHIRVWVGKDLASIHTVLKDSDEATASVPIGGGLSTVE